VFEIGGESSKYIRLEGGSIVDYDRSASARGHRSFLDQQALRMQYSVEEWRDVARPRARRGSRGAARVRQERHDPRAAEGYSPAEILRGLCDAVARNFKSSIVKGGRWRRRSR